MARVILHRELFDYDSALREEFPVICGVDEAGRGPLAGDVYAAAVILTDGTLIDYLNDSKKISESRRELLYDEVIAKAEAYCIATASVEEIDSLNILNATMLAMKRAAEGLGIKPDMALIDGNRLPELECPAQCVIKGDATSASIAAASVLAKVARDRYMRELAAKYPEYCFEQHKGYGTALHCEMLRKYGPSEVHRRSFLKKILGDSNE
ncbi:MAG: ribonuclease HII [Ruminococcus sp.]|nr:ribonuclease HII [Ruminococcus sp.]